MVITEYNITKSFDKKTGKIRHIITKDREIVYDMTLSYLKIETLLLVQLIF